MVADATAVRVGSRTIPTRLVERNAGGFITTEYWNTDFEPPDSSVFDLPALCPPFEPPPASNMDGSSRGLADRLRELLPPESVERLSRQPTMRRLLAPDVDDPRARSPPRSTDPVP